MKICLIKKEKVLKKLFEMRPGQVFSWRGVLLMRCVPAQFTMEVNKLPVVRLVDGELIYMSKDSVFETVGGAYHLNLNEDEAGGES